MRAGLSALLVVYGLSVCVLSHQSCPLLSFRPSQWLSSICTAEKGEFQRSIPRVLDLKDYYFPGAANTFEEEAWVVDLLQG